VAPNQINSRNHSKILSRAEPLLKSGNPCPTEGEAFRCNCLEALLVRGKAGTIKTSWPIGASPNWLAATHSSDTPVIAPFGRLWPSWFNSRSG
jgi:hypothetical protein